MAFLAAFLMMIPLQNADHAKDCCRDKMHTQEVKTCVACGKEGANCKLCAPCAKAKDACSHCMKEKGFTPLFNGKDLTGWVVKGEPCWEAKDGILVCGGSKYGWLRSEKEYESFVWRLEYKVEKEGGNSGMFLRSVEEGDPAFTGMEIQILADAGKPPGVHGSGSLYGSVAPSKNVAKPAGEWNTVEITCNKRSLSVVVNGEKIIDIPNLDDASIPFQNKKLSERAKKGFIGMQNHKDKVEFRNLRLKEIKE